VSDLGKFHHSEEPPDNTNRLVALIIIAVMLAAGAGYAIHTGMFNSNSEQSAKPYPRGL